MHRVLARSIGWLLAGSIVFFSLAPADLRPVSPAPSHIEHVSIFFLAALAFGLAYPNRKPWFLFGLLTFTAAIEIAQLFTPDRHARLSDFIVGALGCSIGMAVAYLLTRHTHAPAAHMNRLNSNRRGSSIAPHDRLAMSPRCRQDNSTNAPEDLL